MGFGNTAIVSVRGMAAPQITRRAPNLTLVPGGARAPAGRGPAPQARGGNMVRTGKGPSRGPSVRTRTGALDANGNVIPGTENSAPDGNPFTNVPCDQFDWANACTRPLGINPTRIITAAGATTQFSITPCGPFRVSCIVVTESNALLWDITSIQSCRTNYLENGALPAEDFSDQSNYACLLACGSVFFPSVPLLFSVRNNSAAGAVFQGIVWGKEVAYCGN